MNKKTILFLLISGILAVSEASFELDLVKSRVFDTDLYERVINSTECGRQMTYLRTRGILLQGRFLDAGVRIPKGVFMLLVTDLGNYYQCLDIDEQEDDMRIEGKYALFTVPFNQTFRLPFANQPNILTERNMQLYKMFRKDVNAYSDENGDSSVMADFLAFAHFNFAACMPKVCSLDDWIASTIFDIRPWGMKVEKMFYRLPNDKPWVAADYVAVAIFSTLGLITVLSTLYDINHIVIRKQDPKKANIYFRTFSVYTNTKRLVTFTPNANALDCLDGIRSISMMWVILGHIFQGFTFFANMLDAMSFVVSGKAVFISTGLFTVDSFFMMAGLLLVYTTVGKLTGPQLLKRLHAFYLNRLLRMFPLLATLVLLEASVFHRIVDGPYWTQVAENTSACRQFWWTTLLHIQNYVNPDNICVKHSWYLAIDIQLHIISPLVLYWVLSKNKKAVWSALIIALLAILTGSTVFNFIKEFPSISASLVRMSEQTYYLSHYYMNTLCRGSAFFIGMITGYIIHIYKGKELKLSKTFVIFGWTIALLLIAFCFYSSYEIMQLDWDNQVLDSLFNSFMRGVWSIGLSWIIFACVKGYGGPINWLFTLKLWKLPARISFAMYLYHFPIMFMYNGVQLHIRHFSGLSRMYDYLAFLMLTFLVAFVVTVVIDAPFSVLIKMAMEGGKRRPREVNGNAKPGPLPIKDVSDLEKDIITTLEKDPSIMEKNRDFLEGDVLERNGKYLNNTGVPFEKNGTPLNNTGVPFEKNGTPLNNTGIPFEKNGTLLNNTGVSFEKTGTPLNNTGVPFEKNGTLGGKSGPLVDRNEVVPQVNDISTATKI